MSLYQLHANKNHLTYRYAQKRDANTPPATCDTIIKDLISAPSRHLKLIKKNKVTTNFHSSPSLKKRNIKKMGRQLTKKFTANIQQTFQVWESSKLVDFLDKIDNQAAKVNGFYTMQPIIVEKNTYNDSSPKWTLLEGQQRITNIYMILKYLESNKIRTNSCNSSADLLNNYFLKTIHYKDWDNYLQNTQDDDSAFNNKFRETYKALHNWFTKKTGVEQEIWKRKLLNHTKFIWYIAEKETHEAKKLLKTLRVVTAEAKYLS